MMWISIFIQWTSSWLKSIIQQEKLQKAAQKAEAAELKKMQKEKKKWEKGKLASKSIVAEIDAKVVELGSVGGKFFCCYFSFTI